MSTLPWTYVFILCFDNGGVHNLLVGSEPIHCSYYFLYASTGFKLIYPTFGGVELLFYILMSILYPTLGGVTPYAYIVIIVLLLSYSRA